MKFTIAIILMIVTLASTRQTDHLEKYTQECSTELKIPSSKLFKYYVPPYLPDDEKIGECFRTCMFKKLGIMDKDSKFKRDGILEMMSENDYNYLGGYANNIHDDNFIASIEKCAKQANLIENVCERAEYAESCFEFEPSRQYES